MMNASTGRQTSGLTDNFTASVIGENINMEYELAAKLRDAGFPQKNGYHIDDYKTMESAYVPKLEDLLTALGEEKTLHMNGPFEDGYWSVWRGTSSEVEEKVHEGPTLEIALSNLWLSLHSK